MIRSWFAILGIPKVSFTSGFGAANNAAIDPGTPMELFSTDFLSALLAIVAGGGSGHEPAHAGFVGKGLLTAAVCGEVFASPSVDAVFELQGMGRVKEDEKRFLR